MKHISEFDFSGHFPLVIEGEQIQSPEDYAEFLVRKAYAYLTVKPEEIEKEKVVIVRKRGGK
jgi:hypothetical protein